tara:strand:- start:104 stop:1258 length:1155 start_codon:yes stop_codon:yes gene_type:complete
MERHEYKLDLVIALLNEHNINIHKLIGTYEDKEMINKVLGFTVEPMTNEDYKELSEKLQGNEHHKDFRNDLQFARNLIIGWLLEDFVYIYLKKQGVDIQRTGNDSGRKLLKGHLASGEPDLLAKLNGYKLWIEVIANFPTKNYDSFWEEKGYFDLRDYKLKNLKLKSKTDRTIVLGLNVAQQKYFTMQVTEALEGRPFSPEEKFGNKNTIKIDFPGGTPTLNPVEKMQYSVKNVLRNRVYKPLQVGYELEGVITQYFEVSRGFCIATVNTDKDLLHVNMKVTTDEAQLYYVYYQEAENNHTVNIPVDHIMNDYDFGFQFSFNDKGRIIYWDGSTIKHHILYNLKQKKVWEQWLDRETKSILQLPMKYVPGVKVARLSEDFQKIM